MASNQDLSSAVRSNKANSEGGSHPISIEQAAYMAALSPKERAFLKTLEVLQAEGVTEPTGLYRMPDLGELLEFCANDENDDSTAEIAANSPRYRRRSSTFIDGVHDLPDEKSSPMAPAQLYSTMSGRLFHSGRIVIVLVGPPARGKT